MKKTAVRIASALFPKKVAAYAYEQLTNPQVRKLRTNEMETLNKADKERISFKGFDIQLYTWEGGNKRVLLVHGWEGQAGNFSDMVEALLADGYTVHAFDGPSHGFSSKGKTSLFEFAELVGVVIRKYGVRKVISHSFGGVATTYSLHEDKGIELDAYVMLTTPDKFTERIDDVAQAVGVTNKVKNKLINRLEEELNMSVAVLNVSDYVQHVNVKRALIIHDKNDKVIPIARSKNVHKNWKASQFKEITGTGHFRILRTPEVIEEVLDFINEVE